MGLLSEVEIAIGEERLPLCALDLPLDLAGFSNAHRWELEIGFGKGRFLLSRAEQEPTTGFLGIEMASRYYRLAARRGQRRSLKNLLLFRGEALYLLTSVLPRRFADAVHVYFPDPWPKSRHRKRRFLDGETVDLVLDTMAPGAVLFFSTDFLDYGEAVAEVLESHATLDVERVDRWPAGARTNYEAKYEDEGRRILRLRARLKERPASVGLPRGDAQERMLVACREPLLGAPRRSGRREG